MAGEGKKKRKDPLFAITSLNTVKRCKAELLHFLDAIADEPFASLRKTDPLLRARRELESIRKAEDEISELFF